MSEQGVGPPGGIGAGRPPLEQASAFIYYLPEPRNFALWIGCAVAILVAMNCAAIPVYFSLDSGGLRWLSEMFLLDSEASVPAFASFLLFLIAALAVAVVTLVVWGKADPWRWHWLFLSLAMLVLAYDEAASIHERFNWVGELFVERRGIFLFSWLIPGGAVTLLFAFAYLRFLLALPRVIGALIVVSGAVFVAGAVGLEMVGGAVRDATLDRTMSYYFVATAEEMLEMSGLALFAYAMLRYLHEHADPVGLRLQTRSHPRHCP